MDGPVNLLSLDGGGIRGISSILILHEIMQRLQHDQKLESLPRPCDYFHLIGGTSTGGLIALMLGRLKMTTKETLKAYNTIAGAVFSKRNKKPIYKEGTFRASTLEIKIKEVVAGQELGEYMLNEAGSDLAATGKVFVCAVPNDNMSHPRLFRSYKVRENTSANCKIWEAARATTAAPTFFKPARIFDGDGASSEDFLDGGLLYNNPARLVLDEARRIYGDTATIGSLISIGTGRSGVIGLQKPDAFQKMIPLEMIGVLKSLATNCEAVAHALAQQFEECSDLYFRFNVEHGAESTSLEEWEKMNKMQTHTKAYLEDVNVNRSMNTAVRTLRGDRDTAASRITLRLICSTVPLNTLEMVTTSAKRCYLSSPLFTGRADHLKRMKEYFGPRNHTERRRREFLLHGMGGAGKSQLALKFAEDQHDDYEQVFWIDGTDKGTVEHGYRRIAQKMCPDVGPSCSLQVALEAVEQVESKWLLIFDGADDPTQINGLWPPGTQGDVIYTSRDEGLRRLRADQALKVDEMGKEEAISLLLIAARLDMSNENEARASEIALELGFLPLAIDQAGAYIASGECSIDGFLSTMKVHRQQLFENDAYRGASDYDRAVYATWDVSHAALDKRAQQSASHAGHAAKTALQILGIFSCFHFENIAEEIFRKAAESRELFEAFEQAEDVEQGEEFEQANFPLELFQLSSDGQWNEQSFYQGIRCLLSFSLISYDRPTRYFSMHRLVHAWASDRLKVTHNNRPCSKARAILSASIAMTSDEKTANFQRSLLPHIIACLRADSLNMSQRSCQWYSNFAILMIQADRGREADRLFLAVAEYYKQTLGMGDKHTLNSLHGLALSQYHQRLFKEAQDTLSAVLRFSNTIENEDVVEARRRSMLLSAKILRAQGRLDEAMALQMEMLQFFPGTSGYGGESLATLMTDLGATLHEKGMFEEAEELQVLALGVLCESENSNEKLIVVITTNLGMTCRSQKRYGEAKSLLTQALVRSRSVGTMHHRFLLRCIWDLAEIYLEEGERGKALELLSEHVVVSTKFYGSEHADTKRAQAKLDELTAVEGAVTYLSRQTDA
ncbi:uncharacterized protein KY384_007494 [Bacidia gigantensis]|uniref:uncharacterized protein n=1 Tax=Bacidia gigantensis TaxID=2732470 RepID=UPI001D04D631|nr:uncharacterized protein KY384_007494 [Bacidia gigantensis]KAG8527342.1 hypothetical protein KY384_007494 [Bacidia gigantensis]